ncbi:Hypothetical protein NTJ_08715 [Nesidiocoris tenuis]|uniref:Uncharacterized protein n=1 Tax=Nesidiocoris tenuis TaxID=355587 RepID=A0ABN7AUP0_9HEMI|nr:Hypothetical protein NTJ_08715 [Nesidiocoris tenuis]
MEISKHKVLSEMQQQLELASSKCGNLQKQLEIVKDKVVNSSTTHLPLHFNNSHQLHDEKENKSRNGDMSINFDGTFGHDDDHISTLSSSSDDPNDEAGNADIIKVFYERLGHLEHPKSKVDLSDVTSENDLDIDQLLSTVDINEERSEFDDAKSSIGPKKRSNTRQEPKISKSKKTKLKTTRKPNPYEVTLSKIAKTPTKNKRPRIKNKISAKKSAHASPGIPDNRKTSVLGELDKKLNGGNFQEQKQNDGWSENEKDERRNVGKSRSKRALKSNNSPSDLRKTKSSTVAEKNGPFNGNRSLTRLVPKTSSEKQPEAGGKAQEKTAPPNGQTKPAPEANSILSAILNDKLFQRRAKEVENYQNAEAEMRNKIKNQPVQNEPKINGLAETKNVPKPQAITQKTKTVFTVSNKKIEKPTIHSISRQNNQKPITNIVVIKQEETIRADTKPTIFNTKSAKPTIGAQPEGVHYKSEGPNGTKVTSLEKTRDILGNRMPKIKNGFGPRHQADEEAVKPTNRELKTKIAKEVENSKRLWPGDQKRSEIEKKPADRAKLTNHPSLVRTNSQSTMQTYAKKQESPKVLQPNNTKSSVSAFPIVHCKDNEFEVDPFELNQFKKMKDVVMKFNTIPFIVGQSTSKSYHLGLNIQQTYSLFKQTPSVMALKVQNGKPRGIGGVGGSLFACGSSVSGKSLSTRGGARDGCPACDPVPDPSPEQLEDPWAVPQDSDMPVVKICTCLPKRIISFDQVLNQLYFSEMNLRLHPSFLPNKDASNYGQVLLTQLLSTQRMQLKSSSYGVNSLER